MESQSKKENDMRSNSWRLSAPFFLLFVILTFVVKDNNIFWDNLLQASKSAHFYLENNFNQLLVPASIDAGHPPLFGIYLALIFKTFGKTLAIAHFAMLPFLLGIVWQVVRLVSYFTTVHRLPILFLIFSNPILLGQSTLVSADIVLLFFFLLALNGVLYLEKWPIVLGTIGLGWISIRGIFSIVALVAIHFYLHKKIRFLMIFIPVLFTGLAYYGFHFLETGWWLSTTSENWSHHRGLVDLKGLIKNVAVLGWRMLDYGMVVLWIGSVILFFKNRQFLKSGQNRLLFLIPICLLLCYSPALLLFQNPIGHRYVLPFHIVFTILVGIWLTQSSWYKKWMIVLMVLIQLSGNFWVYPKKIAQGWDASLAHLPYHTLMKEMKNYIDEQHLDYQSIGTEFPNVGSRKFIELNKELDGFPQKDFEKNDYILYSNVFNDFSDEQIDDLEKNWIVKKELHKRQVYIILYKKNEKVNFKRIEQSQSR